jgi:hypothetical protein
VCVHLSVLHTYQYIHTASWSHGGEVLLYLFLKPGLLSTCAIYDGREFNAIMALYNTVSFLEFVLDLGTMKRPLLACLVGYVCVSVLCVSWLCKQFGISNTLMFLIKSRIEAVSLSSTLCQERLTCKVLISALWIQWRARRAARFWASCSLSSSFFAAQMTGQ